MFEVNTKTRKKPMSPTKDNPESVYRQEYTIDAGQTSLVIPFEFDANVEIIETVNNSSYEIGIILDGSSTPETVSDEFTTFYVSKGDSLQSEFTPIDGTKPQTITFEIKFI